MRTRDKSLSDYGIDCSRAAELMELARLEENKGLICKAADLSNPGLSTFIIESLTQKKGYDRIYIKSHIPAKRDDFYAYRRKTLALFSLLLEGKTPIIPRDRRMQRKFPHS
uniref:hypothetical protein n=1 Tax=Enterocloster clostridioformis TaxID=1531 RepID=UPI0025A5A1E5|nr:hypothetical protein [Enterocloster clostridioformis]